MLMYGFAGGVFLTLYMLVVVFALLMTFDEHRRSENANPFYNALSFVACLFWPVTLLAVAVVVQRKAKAPTAPAS